MFSSHGRSIAAAVFALALALFVFAHADTTPSTSPVSGPQQSAPVAVPIGVSLSTSLSLNANLIPENAIIPVAALATSTASVTSTPPFIASTTNATLIASLYAEVQTLEAQIAALEAAPPRAYCSPLNLASSLAIGSKGVDVSALQTFLRS